MSLKVEQVLQISSNSILINRTMSSSMAEQAMLLVNLARHDPTVFSCCRATFLLVDLEHSSIKSISKMPLCAPIYAE